MHCVKTRDPIHTLMLCLSCLRRALQCILSAPVRTPKPPVRSELGPRETKLATEASGCNLQMQSGVGYPFWAWFYRETLLVTYPYHGYSILLVPTASPIWVTQTPPDTSIQRKAARQTAIAAVTLVQPAFILNNERLQFKLCKQGLNQYSREKTKHKRTTTTRKNKHKTKHVLGARVGMQSCGRWVLAA